MPGLSHLNVHYSEAITRGTRRRTELHDRARQLEVELQELLRCCSSAIRWFKDEIEVEKAKDAIVFDYNDLKGKIVFGFVLDDGHRVDVRVQFTLEAEGVNAPLRTIYAGEVSAGQYSLSRLFTKMQNDMNKMFMRTHFAPSMASTIHLPTETISYRELKRKIEWS